MSDDEYTNLDLETAEQILYAAGKPELAKALHAHAHGVRNLVQGEWGKAFVAAMDGIMERHLGPLTNEIGGLRGDTNALQAEFRAGLQGIQSTVSTLTETVDQLQQEGHARDEQIRTLSDDMAAIKAIIEARPAQRQEEAARFEARQVALEARLNELEAARRKYTPEQIQIMTDVLPRMIADWLASHPDEAHGDGQQ